MDVSAQNFFFYVKLIWCWSFDSYN